MGGKYNNSKTIIAGTKFDSRKEANRYCELTLLEKAGAIKDLELQPVFILEQGIKKAGKTIVIATHNERLADALADREFQM